MNDNITEAQYLEDWGSVAEYECMLKDRVDIEEDRYKRLNKLKGKYIISCNGYKTKKQVFLQDQRISNKGYWTEFLSNALGFKSIEETTKVLSKLRYNNPYILLVDNQLNFIKCGQSLKE